MKKMILQKILAVGLTIVFFALVRPDPDPSIPGVSLCALCMYEVALWCVRRGWRAWARKRRKLTWADVEFKKMKEVI